jgi:hypothetical protein
MEARDAKTRQRGHFQRYGAPRRETPAEPPGATEMAANEQQGRGPIPEPQARRRALSASLGGVGCSEVDGGREVLGVLKAVARAG